MRVCVKVDDHEVEDVAVIEEVLRGLRAVHVRIERVVAHRHHREERGRLWLHVGDIVEHRGPANAGGVSAPEIVAASCRREAALWISPVDAVAVRCTQENVNVVVRGCGAAQATRRTVKVDVKLERRCRRELLNRHEGDHLEVVDATELVADLALGNWVALLVRDRRGVVCETLCIQLCTREA